MDENKFKDNLIELRKSKGFTQKELADDINYSDKVISKWERGESYPNIEALTILSNYFSISIDKLIQHEVINETDGTKLVQLDVIRTESPSILAYLFIVPFAAFTILVFLIGVRDLYGPSLSTLGVAIMLYGFLLSKATFETKVNGKCIMLKNNGFKAQIYIDGALVHTDKSTLKVNPVISLHYEGYHYKFEIKNVTSIKCNIYVTQ